MRGRRTSDSGNRPYSHLTLLWFALSESLSYPSSTTVPPTDASVFVVIVVLAAKSGIQGYKIPKVLRTILQDATLYFLVIFTSHFVFEASLLFARVSASITVKTEERS